MVPHHASSAFLIFFHDFFHDFFRDFHGMGAIPESERIRS